MSNILNEFENYVENSPVFELFSHVVFQWAIDNSSSPTHINLSANEIRLLDDGGLGISSVDPKDAINLHLNAVSCRHMSGRSFQPVYFINNTLNALNLLYRPSVTFSLISDDTYVVTLVLGKVIVYMFGDYTKFCDYIDITINHFMTVMDTWLSVYTEKETPDNLIDLQVWASIKPQFKPSLSQAILTSRTLY